MANQRPRNSRIYWPLVILATIAVILTVVFGCPTP
jgi:hypothetical protein